MHLIRTHLDVTKRYSCHVLGGLQEPRLGRWAHIPTARNGVMLHRLNFEDED